MIPPTTSSLPRAAARAQLSEALFSGASSLAESARATAVWVSRHGSSPQVLVALVDGLEVRGLAGAGLPAEQVQGFRLRRDRDPLAAVLSGQSPRWYGQGALGEASPAGRLFGAEPLLALPLRREEEEQPLGLLLATSGDPSPSRNLVYAAQLLSARLLAGRYPAVRREATGPAGQTLLRSVIGAVPDPIALTDAEGRLRLANVRAERLLVAPPDADEGIRRAVALNNMLFTACLLPREDAPRQPAGRRELALVDPADGQELLFELISAPLTEPRDGASVVSVLHDVSDLHQAMAEVQRNCRKLRQAEAVVRAERDRLDLIISAVADPVLVTEPAGEIVLMNPPAVRLFTERAEGDPGSERWVRSNDAVLSSFLANLSTRRTLRWRGELSLVDPQDGTPLPVEALAGKVVSAEGEDIAVVTILHDRREAQEKAELYEQVKRHSQELERRVQEATAELVEQNELLRRQAIALEQASATKSQFLANISHELRTPLQAIIGYTQLLLQQQRVAKQTLAEGALTKLERVDSNARHLLGVINDLLDITRIEAGSMPLHLETFSMASLIDEVFEEVEPLIARSRLRVSRRVDPDLGEVRSDRKKLKQVVLNLLSNALKFTPEGLVMVQARLDGGGHEALIEVADTGIGIGAEDQVRIFEEFQQADSSLTRHYGGTGLGLPICKRLVEMLGGTIALVSTPGSGSTFSVRLPRHGGDA